MTKAERDLIIYLINEGGDTCQKCIHCGKESCSAYNAETGEFDKESDVDYCIDGMVKYFEQRANKK